MDFEEVKGVIADSANTSDTMDELIETVIKKIYQNGSKTGHIDDSEARGVYIRRKMWNALYKEEDRLEKEYVDSEECNEWFSIYRPWLQRGFEIALKAISEEL